MFDLNNIFLQVYIFFVKRKNGKIRDLKVDPSPGLFSMPSRLPCLSESVPWRNARHDPDQHSTRRYNSVC